MRAVNTLNTPIDSATWNGSGRGWHGTYLLTFTKTGPTVTVDVEAQGQAADERNPYGDRSGLPVVADGSTPNVDIVPNVDLVISASVDTGWQGKVTIGNYLDGVGDHTEILEWEVVEAGLVSEQRQIACRNVGTQTAEDTEVFPLPGFTYDGVGSDTYVEAIRNHSDPDRHKLAPKGTKVITFANWEDDPPSGKKRADVLVDGNTAVTDALFDGVTVYEYGEPTGKYDDGNDYLEGLGIILPDIATDPTSSSITLTTRDGWAWVQFAPDVTGAPGTWEAAGDDLTLGNILAANHELFWARINLPGSVSPEDPGRQFNIRARGLSI
jgi:hypothetical protein